MRLEYALLGLIAAAGVSGCAAYSLVEARPRPIADRYTVHPQIQWSETTQGSLEIWTVDGHALEAVLLTPGLEDGEPLFAAAARPQGVLPVFRSHLSPNGVMDFVVDSLASTGANAVEATGLRPQAFDSEPGFRFDLSYLTADGLEMRGLAAGSTIDGRLYLILYTATRAHHFSRYVDLVERMIASIDLL